MFYIGIYRENKKSCLKPQSLDIMYVASSSEPLPSLFKLCPWGAKKRHHPGFHTLYLYKEKLRLKKLMETSKFLAGLWRGSYAFLYLYKQSFSG